MIQLIQLRQLQQTCFDIYPSRKGSPPSAPFPQRGEGRSEALSHALDLPKNVARHLPFPYIVGATLAVALEWLEWLGGPLRSPAASLNDKASRYIAIDKGVRHANIG